MVVVNFLYDLKILEPIEFLFEQVHVCVEQEKVFHDMVMHLV